MTEALTTAVGSVFTLVGDVLTEITGQPFLAILLVGTSVVPLGIRIFKKLKRA